jgi:hypothetical protein
MKTPLRFCLRTLAFALPVLCISSCQPGKGNDSTRRAVDPVLATEMPFQDFEINGTAGDTVRLTDGTSIYIPPGIFVDGNGKPVNGNVQLHYRAFYTPGEIIASGITMLYDTAGTEQVFTSAGMFELTGSQNGQPVSIAPGKSISMDFASSYNDMAFNFYNLDTATATWNFLTTTTADSNELRQQLQSVLSAMPVIRRPVQPREYDPAQPLIGIDADIEDHPELSGYNNLVWQYAGSGPNPDDNKWIYGQDWNSAKLYMTDTNTCMYNMKLSGGDKSFSTNVYPALKGENYKEALTKFREKMIAYTASEVARQEKRIALAKTEAYQRSLSISRFGFFNCDIFAAFGQTQVAQFDFHFEDPEFEAHRDEVVVYVVTAGGRLVSGYSAAEPASFRFTKNLETGFVAVHRGTEKAAVFQFAEFSSLQIASNFMTKIKLHPVNHPVASGKDIDDLILKL